MRREKKQMKRVFLIDTENVGCSFVDQPGLKKLTTSDVIYVFHNTIRGNDLSKKITDALCNIKATVKKIYLTSANKNAMDFGLMCELGQMMKENGNNCEYYIVSNDRAFEVATDIAKSNGITTKVRRIPTLDYAYDEEGRIRAEEEAIRQLLPEKFSKRVVKTVQQGFDASKTKAEFIVFIHHHLWYDRKEILQMVDKLADDKYQIAKVC